MQAPHSYSFCVMKMGETIQPYYCSVPSSKETASHLLSGTSRCASHTGPNDEPASAWKPAPMSSLSRIVRDLRFLPYTKASNSVHQLPE